ncbi:TonB-dependent receptor domain-containing protein [Pedomonas mirosovicensis]|uniref:TonB-dependent receptor domain-containing protein n=1 Tax=Pedomonas mirosovicensis TaxID=2908641 RepID=UPI002167F8E5|nr:TonB-dependent receptor [Pedomonas mirosovicensis]MCH8686512.1 TonB-dependent receptor [Pedomonas mirosovicensis]
MCRSLRGILVSATSLTAIVIAAQPVIAAETREQLYEFNIPAQDLGSALNAFARAANQQVTFDPAAVRGKTSAALSGQFSARAGIDRLLAESGLSVRVGQSGVFIVQPAAGASAGEVDEAAPSAGARRGEATLADIIVTAQKREERISDVPIAITALTAEGLDDRKIEGGSELLRAIPNVNFSKSNFSMYNFSIRGVGTKAISASSDPAVAVSFNNTPLVRNRLFESEFFDMARVEVLRGPQGTLYGRNATAGVVNMIPALPEPEFGGEIKGELGNYKSKRLSGMLNVPITDTLGVRVAGAWTKRDGYDYNTFTENRVNDRDLWSTRASVQWEPSDRFRASVIWQHFEENDNRSRTGKQLCTTDPGLEMVGDIPITDPRIRGKLSQGCLPGSLYDDAAYGTPNGDSLVYITHPADNITLGAWYDPTRPRGRGDPARPIKSGDPFEGVTQSRDLREISTSIDPVFRAKNDVVQFNMDFDVADGLQLVSQTAYARDRFYSMQDYNRFVTNPLFNDTAQPIVDVRGNIINEVNKGPTPGGIFCDPQLGCSDRMLSADLSRSRNRQWSQELRLQSSFEGPVNFNIGANYLDFKSQDDYYVFNNMFTFIADWFYSRDPRNSMMLLPCELGDESRECPYVDRNPIDSLDNQGHNYFLSQNGVRIKSWAAFGELYWELADNLNLTLGLRYTKDKKVSDQIPSQLLLGGGIDSGRIVGDSTGGRVNSGYPALDSIEQTWGKFTGRAVLDWKPELSFTDDTLIYFSAARGYKGGGVNPPRVDFNSDVVQYQYLPQTFKPEYVTSLEIGTKNSFDGGRLTLNANGFLYNYKDYQISQIVDRIAYNENFDAINWGLELEAAWRPTRAFRLDGTVGYLKTRLKKGSQSIDVMNRTQGDSDWVTLRPWVQVPSNCIAPRAFVEKVLSSPLPPHQALAALCPGSTRVGTFDPKVNSGFMLNERYGFTYDPFAPYNPDTVGMNIEEGGSGAPNGGRGFAADLTGNELPNAPRITVNIGAQYTFFSETDDWDLTFRADYYRQSKSYARIYNTEFDRLKAWDYVNLTMTYTRPKSELTMQVYVKNVFNNTPITDTFVNSDDTGLTTNVFTLDPRIIAFSISKKF